MAPASHRLHALAQSHLAHLTGAFVVMGSWAFFANSGHAFDDALTAAVLQGSLSALITLTLKTFIEKVAPHLSGRKTLWIPPLAAFTVVGLGLMLLHHLSGTPEILATIALPLTAATVYAAVYNFTLWRTRRV